MTTSRGQNARHDHSLHRCAAVLCPGSRQKPGPASPPDQDDVIFALFCRADAALNAGLNWLHCWSLRYDSEKAGRSFKTRRNGRAAGSRSLQTTQRESEAKGLVAITAKKGSPFAPIQPRGPVCCVCSATNSGLGHPCAIITSAT